MTKTVYRVHWADIRGYQNVKVKAETPKGAARKAVDRTDLPSYVEGVEVSVYERVKHRHDVIV